MENCERAECGPRQHHEARSRDRLAREPEGWNVSWQGASPGDQWLDMHARHSRKASARPDVRGRDHDEVARGDSGREEAGHRSRRTVLYADGRGEAGTGGKSGKKPEPGQRKGLYLSAVYGRAFRFS